MPLHRGLSRCRASLFDSAGDGGGADASDRLGDRALDADRRAGAGLDRRDLWAMTTTAIEPSVAVPLRLPVVGVALRRVPS